MRLLVLSISVKLKSPFLKNGINLMIVVKGSEYSLLKTFIAARMSAMKVFGVKLDEVFLGNMFLRKHIGSPTL